MPAAGRAALILLCALAVRDDVPRRAIVGGAPVWSRAEARSPRRVRGPHHYIRGYAPRTAAGHARAVIENPAGTTGKLEVDHSSGDLVWDGRAVDYLPFPANYGLVPRTLSGDGDPLDVLVLGRAIERGAVLEVRPIAVIDMIDEGAVDPKVLAVPLGAEYRGFRDVFDLDELERGYPGVRAQLHGWLENYKGDLATVRGWRAADAAERLIDEAAERYRLAR